MECRICLGDAGSETMFVPCRCRGTSAYVHDSCLRTYFRYYPDRICRVCHELMEHPWVDRERALVCALLLLLWSAILVALSTAPIGLKTLTYTLIVTIVLFHLRYRQLSYATTLLCITASGLLAFADPQYLMQMVFLTMGLLMLATLCIFIPLETVFLVIVTCLGLLYSLLLILALASKSDPAFTGLGLMGLGVLWIAGLRPGRRNDLWG